MSLAKYVKYSVCSCGFPILSESVEIGTLYDIDTTKIRFLSLQCGGCKSIIRNLPCIWVEARGSSKAGYLPVEIFQFLS